MNDANERKRQERARMKKAGFRRLELWAKPKNHPKIKTYAGKLQRRDARGEA